MLKIYSLAGEGLEAASADPLAWDYWKREWLVYRSEWLRRLGGRFQAPRCLRTGESGEGHAWIAMEDLTAADVRPWPLDRFGAVAEHGEFGGAHLTGAALPAETWLATGWLRRCTQRAEPMVALLPTVADHPLVARMYPPALIEDLLRLWGDRDRLFDLLDALPQTLCHQDVFPRNVFAGSHGDRSVAIDWANAGMGPLGQGLGPLVGASLAFFEAEGLDPDEVEAQCLQGYLRGLVASGWRGCERDVEFGYLASEVLRYPLGGIGPMLIATLDEQVHGLVEQVFERPIEQVVDNLHAHVVFQRERIRRVDRMSRTR